VDAKINVDVALLYRMNRKENTCVREMNIHNEAPVTHFPSKHEKQITHKIIDISIFCASRTLSVSVCACTSCFRTFLFNFLLASV